MRSFLYFLILFTIGNPIFSGCSCNEKESNRKLVSRQQLIEMNRALVARDSAVISKYSDKETLGLRMFPTGFWMNIIENIDGDSIQPGDVLEMQYRVALLDGTVCYSSQERGVMRFLSGQGGVEAGLEDAVGYLSPGDSAVVLLPPHLAHGLVGDDDKIPARAFIRYDVRITKVERKAENK